MTLKLKTALYLKVRKLDFNATLHLKSWGREKSHMKFSSNGDLFFPNVVYSLSIPSILVNTSP